MQGSVVQQRLGFFGHVETDAEVKDYSTREKAKNTHLNIDNTKKTKNTLLEGQKDQV